MSIDIQCSPIDDFGKVVGWRIGFRPDLRKWTECREMGMVVVVVRAASQTIEVGRSETTQ